MSLLDASRSALQAQADADKELASLAARVNELLILATDISSDLSSYMASLDVEGPERLAQVQTRRAQLATLTRKYGTDIAEVLDGPKNPAHASRPWWMTHSDRKPWKPSWYSYARCLAPRQKS